MRKISIILTIFVMFMMTSMQESYYVMSQPVESTLKNRTVTVPAGQKFKAILTTPVSSANAVVGQNVTMVLNSDLFYGSKMIAPKGSSILGSIIETSCAKHGSLNGKITLRFSQIVTPQGTNIPVSVIINTEDGTGSIVGGSSSDANNSSAKNLVYNGNFTDIVATSPVLMNGIGTPTSITRSVGNGGGLVKSIWDKGVDVTIPVGTLLELLLTQPITVDLANTEIDTDD